MATYKERMARMRENRRKASPQKFFVGDRVTVIGRGDGKVTRVRAAACGFEKFADDRNSRAWDYLVRLDETAAEAWFGSHQMTTAVKKKKKGRDD